ncbi:MAG: GNAT family N-acetyltransferase [Candidatus Omnitrophota bacterium]
MACLFLFNDLAFAAPSMPAYTLAPELRSRSFSEGIGSEVEMVARMMSAAGEIRNLIESGNARENPIKRLNEFYFPNGEVKIEPKLKDGVLTTTKREYKAALFHLKTTNKTIEARFFKDPDLNDDELLELGARTDEDKRHFFNSPEFPALRGVWFVGAERAHYDTKNQGQITGPALETHPEKGQAATYTMRPLTKDFARMHSGRLVDLHNQIMHTQWTEEEFLADLWKAGDHGRVEDRVFWGKWEHSFVAVDEAGQPIGYVLAYERPGGEISGVLGASLYVHGISVDPAMRGRGIGAELLYEAAKKLNEKGFTHLTGAGVSRNISLQVNTENTSAIRLYERSGLKRVGSKQLGNGFTDYIYLGTAEEVINSITAGAVNTSKVDLTLGKNKNTVLNKAPPTDEALKPVREPIARLKTNFEATESGPLRMEPRLRVTEIGVGSKWAFFAVVPTEHGQRVPAAERIRVQIRSALENLDRLLAEGRITKDDISRMQVFFGDITMEERDEIRQALLEYYGTGVAPPVISCIEQSPADGSMFAFEISAAYGKNTAVYRISEHVAAVENDGMIQVYVGGITPDPLVQEVSEGFSEDKKNDRRTGYGQAWNVMEKTLAELNAAETELKRLGKIPGSMTLDYRQVLRTWYYQERILEDDPGGYQFYQGLNDARYDFFTTRLGGKAFPFGEGLIEGASQDLDFWPASTGIGMLSRKGKAETPPIVMEALATIPKHAGLTGIRLESARQMNPFEYDKGVLKSGGKKPPLWSRAVTFLVNPFILFGAVLPPKMIGALTLLTGTWNGLLSRVYRITRWPRLFHFFWDPAMGGEIVSISGTASTKGQYVKYVGDPVRQTLYMLESVQMMLTQRLGDLEHIPFLRVYIKRPQDYAVIKKTVETKFPDIPVIFTNGDVCRPDWLVEVEAFAFIPFRREHVPIVQAVRPFTGLMEEHIGILSREQGKDGNLKYPRIYESWLMIKDSSAFREAGESIDKSEYADDFSQAVRRAWRVLEEESKWALRRNAEIMTPQNARLIRQALDVALHHHMKRLQKVEDSIGYFLNGSESEIRSEYEDTTSVLGSGEFDDESMALPDRTPAEAMEESSRPIALGNAISGKAGQIHAENIKSENFPVIAEREIICHIITDSILPHEQRGMLKVSLDQNMDRYGKHIERIAALSGKNTSDPDLYIRDLSSLMARKRALYEKLGYDKVRFTIACPDVKLVDAVMSSGIPDVKALAFEPRNSHRFNLVHVDGIMLALRALYGGDLDRIKKVFEFLSGGSLPKEYAGITDIDTFIRKVSFVLPAAKIENGRELKEAYNLIANNIWQAA